MGLYGVDAAMPSHMIDEIVMREEGHEAVEAFLDQFNHRFVALLYRAWKKYRYPESFRAGGSDAHSRNLLCLAGYGWGDKPQRAGLSDSRMLAPEARGQSVPDSCRVMNDAPKGPLMNLRFTVSTVASFALLSACGAWQSVSDASSSAYHAVFFKQIKLLDIDLSAREALNPDDAARATSVAVRVYQLKDRKTFDGASYEDLLKNDRTVLAQDLQVSMASVLNPGASASLSQPMRADTNYVAVVAFYRNPGSGDGWKYVIEKKKLDADKPLKISLMDQFLVPAGSAAHD